LFFWNIPEPSHCVSAFLAWVEGLPVSIVNGITVSESTSPTDVEALADVEHRIDRWLSESAEHNAVMRHLELRIRVGGWSSASQAAILQAAIAFAALDPVDRDLRAVHLIMDPFDALGPIGSLLD
jgi:hypothetical protein